MFAMFEGCGVIRLVQAGTKGMKGFDGKTHEPVCRLPEPDVTDLK
ncbi:hypothetical protein [Streptomyces roseochromogenus]|uniref:Uncharacterized protein n=1 Tax=Streptomyces roseochromogenus subsp. oscitans DS 12.976 TaxID=1352936 RepID=V6KA91_STRRC|nr:hypothetical protein [Streptomyces roseochromogenus]EST25894.1 hypothetical protein M878_27820 [Streptomyces roseochromogenus subsp. oscitans DS 12.976]